VAVAGALAAETAEVAVVGGLHSTSPLVGVEGFNVLHIANWTWEANVVWLDEIIASGEAVRVFPGGKITVDEIEYLLDAGYHWWGNNWLMPPL
jgi:hypothetical protein